MAACVRLAPLSRRSHAREEQAMRGADKVICQAAAVLLLFSVCERRRQRRSSSAAVAPAART